MTTVDLPPSTSNRIAELLALFKLPTIASQVVRRFIEAGQDDALGTLLEVLEAELDERSQRRCERLLRASQLPPGKTFETLDERACRARSGKLHELATGASSTAPPTSCASACPAAARRTPPPPSATPSSSAASPSSSPRPSASCRSCSPPSATWRCPGRSRSSTPSTLLILDDIGYVQQSADEVEVLFTLMAERYERAPCSSPATSSSASGTESSRIP